MSSFHDYMYINFIFTSGMSYIRRSVNRSCFNLDKINLGVLQGITCLKQIVGCHSNIGTLLKLWSMCFDKTCKTYVCLNLSERERERERGIKINIFLYFLESIMMWVNWLNYCLHFSAVILCTFTGLYLSLDVL